MLNLHMPEYGFSLTRIRGKSEILSLDEKKRSNKTHILVYFTQKTFWQKISNNKAIIY